MLSADEAARERCGNGAIAVRLVTAATLPAGGGRAGAARAAAAPGTALPAEPKVIPLAGRPQPAQRRLSYSSLQDYARCALPLLPHPRARACRASPPPPDERRAGGARARRARAARGPRARHARARCCSSGWTSPGRGAAGAEAGARAVAAAHGLELEPAHVDDVRAQVAAFAASPLCARLARRPRRRAARRASRSRSSPAAAARSSPASSTCIAREADGTVLVVDYKTDRLGEEEPGGARRARLHDPAHGLRPRRAAGRRARASRSPTACSSARRSPSPRRSRRPTRRRSPTRCCGLAGGVLAERVAGGRAPAPRAVRRLPRPAHAVLVARGDDAAPAAEAYEESAGTLAGSGGPS